MMHDVRHALALAVAMGCALAGSSCGKRPSQFCDEWYAEYTATYERCGDTVFTLRNGETGEALTCANAYMVTGVAELQNVCYPWLRTVDCADFSANPDLHIPECSVMHFSVIGRR